MDKCIHNIFIWENPESTICPFSWTFIIFMSKYIGMSPREKEINGADKPKVKYKPPQEVKPEHKEFLTRVGARLEEIRKETKMTSSELCKKTKMSRYTYYLISRGQVYWNSLSLLDILTALNINETQFFSSIKKKSK